MTTVDVRHIEGDQFELSVRGHLFRVDQPVADGGQDSAPTPTELFISGLAACVAFYARRYLARHHLPTEGLSVSADYVLATRPARVGEITMHLQIPADVPEDKRAALLAVASHCTVQNTLDSPPTVKLDLGPVQGGAA